MGRVIAIDGPSGAGKSTVSKLIAERLGFEFLDTGALYRAAALHLRRKGLDENNTDDDIKRALNGISVFFKEGRVYLKENSELYPGEDVSEAIRTTEAGHYASVFSARKAVRDFLFQVQRDAAIRSDIVAEGRDMTTVVFPDAWKKFYLDASEEGRAKRRYLQLKEKGIEITMEEALRDVRERDERDSKRDIAPLKKADDAVCIDTTDLSLNEVIEKILKAIGDRR
ncbi:MAG: (d)CMP kinase [Nitrospirae bacterium]|nr:(d)CMP kinase [Nitrospirota bacterium]